MVRWALGIRKSGSYRESIYKSQFRKESLMVLHYANIWASFLMYSRPTLLRTLKKGKTLWQHPVANSNNLCVFQDGKKIRQGVLFCVIDPKDSSHWAKMLRSSEPAVTNQKTCCVRITLFCPVALKGIFCLGKGYCVLRSLSYHLTLQWNRMLCLKMAFLPLVIWF